MEDVVIVGAGSAGLALAYELKRLGVPPVIVDAAARVAEPWRQRHPQLRLNTSRDLSHQPGLIMPRSFDPLPTRDQYVGYLEQYVDFLGLPIRWNTSVQKIRRDGAGWRLETDAGTTRARHLVLATGPDRKPSLPSWPDRAAFRGRLVHAAQFGHASAYAGRKVLIVGARDSAIDVANHLSRAGIAGGWIAVRSGAWISPMYGASGRPSHETFVALRYAPEWALNAAIRFASRSAFGDLGRYGFPGPAEGAATRFRRDGGSIPTDDGFVAALRSGLFRGVPAVVGFDGAQVVLADGSTVEPDDVICATGYAPDLQALAGPLVAVDGKGRPLAGEDRPVAHGSLWLFGLRSSLFGNMFVRRQRARRTAAAIAAAVHRSS